MNEVGMENVIDFAQVWADRTINFPYITFHQVQVHVGILRRQVSERTKFRGDRHIIICLPPA